MICSLKVLQSLHLYLVDKTFEDICDDLHLASLKTIKDLVYSVSYSAPLYLDPFHRQKWTSLEVLVFQGGNPRTQAFDLPPPSAQAYVAPLSSGNDISVCLPDQVRFSTLTHLDLSLSLATESLEHIASILPKLNLVHFGSGLYTNDLLKYVNVRSLKALSVEFQGEYDAQTLVDLLRQNKDECQLDSLMLRCSSHMEVHFPVLLKCVPLKRLFLLISNKTTLEGILRSLNYSRLQLLSIYCDKYDWSTEKIVAEKGMSFRSDLTVELGDSGNRNGRNVFSANSRDVQGTSASLARDQVILNKTNYANECLRFSLLAIPSNTLELIILDHSCNFCCWHFVNFFYVHNLHSTLYPRLATERSNGLPLGKDRMAGGLLRMLVQASKVQAYIFCFRSSSFKFDFTMRAPSG
jgi:hypothetical protein